MALPKRLRDVARRAGFEIPSSYVGLHAANLLRCDWPEGTPPPALHCANHPGPVEWMTPAEIAGWEPPDHWTETTLVPFAEDGHGGFWCWVPADTDDRGTPVALVLRDDEEVTIYACDFEAFLFRAFVDSTRFVELEGMVPPGDKAGHVEYLRANRTTLRPYLRPAWDRELGRLLKDGRFKARRKKGEEGCFTLLSDKAVEALLARRVLVGRVGDKCSLYARALRPSESIDTTVPEPLRVLAPLVDDWGKLRNPQILARIQAMKPADRRKLGQQVIPHLDALHDWLMPLDAHQFTEEMWRYSHFRVGMVTFRKLLDESS